MTPKVPGEITLLPARPQAASLIDLIQKIALPLLAGTPRVRSSLQGRQEFAFLPSQEAPEVAAEQD